MARAAAEMHGERAPTLPLIRLVSRVNPAAHDVIAVGYLGLLAGSLWLTPVAAGHAVRHQASALFVVVTAAIVVARATAAPPPAVVFVYRLAMIGTVGGSYLLLADALPLLREDAFDSALYALDLRAFGGEPAVWLERFAAPAATEWFSFFYLSYFLVLVAFVVPVLFAARGGSFDHELVLGLVLLYAVGQSIYVLVPGYGPWHAMPELFARPLEGGFFFADMMATVRAAGAQKDIFPSLHAAAPLYLAILAFRHRKRGFPFTLWPVAALVWANITVATMYLRWHYLVDVVVGIVLALVVAVAASRTARLERDARASRGRGEAWPALRTTRPWGGPGASLASTQRVDEVRTCRSSN